MEQFITKMLKRHAHELIGLNGFFIIYYGGDNKIKCFGERIDFNGKDVFIETDGRLKPGESVCFRRLKQNNPNPIIFNVSKDYVFTSSKYVK